METNAIGPGNGPPRATVAILAALAVEEAAIIKALGNCAAYQERGQLFHVGDAGGQRVLVFRIGMGNASAAVTTARLIDAWNLTRLMLVGIAGGAQGAAADMRPGDILVPDQVVGYELAKVTPGDTARRYEVYRPDPELLAYALSLRPADWADEITVPRPDDPSERIRPVIHSGPVLTGDKVMADEKALADLRVAWPKAIGIEMESLGVAMAAYQSRAGFLMVKAVSDFASHVKDDSWQRYAAEAAARFAVAVLAGSARPARTSRLSGEPRAIVIGQVDDDVPGRLGAPAIADGRPTALRSGSRLPVTVHAEPVELLSDVAILVVPQNVFLEVPQHFTQSVSAAVGRASVRRGESGEITADVVGDELRDWLRRHSRPGLAVAPGTVIITSPGEMAGNRIRRLYHAAIAVPRPGTNDYHVEPSAVVDAVGNVLTAARRERAEFDPPLSSIGFPLLGADRGGLEPGTSVSWLWTALEREWRGDPEWDIHFIAKDRIMAELVVGALLEAGAAPQLARPAVS